MYDEPCIDPRNAPDDEIDLGRSKRLYPEKITYQANPARRQKPQSVLLIAVFGAVLAFAVVAVMCGIATAIFIWVTR